MARGPREERAVQGKGGCLRKSRGTGAANEGWGGKVKFKRNVHTFGPIRKGCGEREAQGTAPHSHRMVHTALKRGKSSLGD